MLSFDATAWDLFMPYEQDFLRELDHVWVHGFSAMLVIAPCVQSFANAPVASDQMNAFAWGPDGSYKEFVNMSVLMFITLYAALGELCVPEFLVDDMVSLNGLYEKKLVFSTVLAACFA